MAIPFNPPQELINAYFNRPQPAEAANQGIQQALQTYLQMKQLDQQKQNEALGQYVKAFEAGGPKFAADIASRMGLKNPPALPGVTAKMAGPGGTAGVTSDQQPATSPVIAHWNSAMGAGQSASSQAAPAAQAPVPDQLVPGYDDKALMDMGAFGTKRLAAGEAYQKRQESKQTFEQKQLETAPRSANQLRQDFVLAGQPDKADAWLQAHAPESLSDPDKPLINVAQIKEAKDWLGTGAMQMRGAYFDTMGNIQTQKLREGLMKDARTTLDPMFQTGEGKAQMQRLNNIGRTEPLIAQMLSQKGGGDPRQMGELATRVDSVLKGSPGGQQAVEGINRLIPQTALGKYASWVEWFSSNPKGTEQQAFIKRYADTITREKTAIQGQVKQTAERGAGTLRVLKSQFPDDYNAVVNPYLEGKYTELTGPQAGPAIGAIEDGHRFKGGNPADPNSWELVSKQ